LLAHTVDLTSHFSRCPLRTFSPLRYASWANGVLSAICSLPPPPSPLTKTQIQSQELQMQDASNAPTNMQGSLTNFHGPPHLPRFLANATPLLEVSKVSEYVHNRICYYFCKFYKPTYRWSLPRLADLSGGLIPRSVSWAPISATVCVQGGRCKSENEKSKEIFNCEYEHLWMIVCLFVCMSVCLEISCT